MHPTRDFDTGHDDHAEQPDPASWAGEPDFASVVALGAALAVGAVMLLVVILATMPG